MLDQDGFQQVRYRKNTRRNIFEHLDGGGRIDASEQELEIQIGQIQCGQMPVEKPTTKVREGNQQEEEGDLRDNQGEGQTHINPTSYEEGSRRRSSWGQLEGIEELESRPAAAMTVRELGKMTDTEEDTGMQEAGAEQSNGSSPKDPQTTSDKEVGRGDPTSTMLW